MKRFFTTIFLIALQTTILFAQSPALFNYQAVVRNSSGTVIQNQPVGVQMSILQGFATGNVVYKEEHPVTTNQFGLVNLVIGNGQNPVGSISSINWGIDSYYIKIEIDVTGGTNYVVMGTNQLLSVPYALYAASGTPGPQGIQGVQGIQGIQGIQGPAGQDGANGTNGSDGIGVVNTYVQNDSLYIYLTNGNTINAGHVTGQQGSQGIQGIQGVQGAQGAQGLQGLQGPAGTYTAGTGITISGDTVYNTQPDQAVTLQGAGATTVSGSYPDFTIMSTDSNTTYQAGAGLSLNGTTFNSTWTASGNDIFNNNFGNVGIGTNTPLATLDVMGTIRYDDGGAITSGKVLTSDASGYVNWQSPAIGSANGMQNYIAKFSGASSLGNSLFYESGPNIGLGTTTPGGRFVVMGDSLTPDTVPLFEVKDKTGATVMAVYPDSIHFYVKDPGGSKTQNRGSFAVSGKSSVKSFTNHYLFINPDSTRIYTSDTLKGFGVRNIGVSAITSYMQLTPINYFIGHEAGSMVSTGYYNLFMGYKSGKLNTSGLYNTFLGYQTGMSNTTGQGNVFIGLKSGENNTDGNVNTFVGTESGYNNTTGHNNTFIGAQSGYTNSDGSYNTFLGCSSGQMNINGAQNTFLGSLSGLNNTSGSNNLFVGSNSGSHNTTGSNNVFLGPVTGLSNDSGSYNIFIGSTAGYYNVSGYNNVFIGDASGMFNTTGSDNVCIGRNTGSNLSGGWRNVFIGTFTGYYNTTGNYNAFFGGESGLSNTTGNNNSFFGYQSGNYTTIGNDNSFFGTKSGLYNATGAMNSYFGSFSGYSNIAGDRNVCLGFYSGYFNTGSSNVFIGYTAGMYETGSARLYISNDATNPSNTLIYGEFDNKIVRLNAKVNINDVMNIAPRNTAPTGPAEGDIYMDSVSHKLMVFDGTTWQACW